MKGKDIVPWIIGLICSGAVIGLLRGSGIVLGGLPTVLIAIGCVAVVGFIGKSIKKDKPENDSKTDNLQGGGKTESSDDEGGRSDRDV